MSSPQFTHPSLDISKRQLPALPINKRALPILPQSKSDLVNSKCEENKSDMPECTQIATSRSDHAYVVGQTRMRSKAQHKSTASTSLRNLFNNIQQKMSGSKTRLQNKRNPYKLTSKYEPQNNNDISAQIINSNNNKSKWKPTLQFICKKDTQLLEALIAFMTKQFNEENILFLRAVNELNNKINRLCLFNRNGKDIDIVKSEKVNVEILSIYNKYITNTAHKQINLSSECFIAIMENYQNFKPKSLKEKKNMFTECVSEIERLITTSVMTRFYKSIEFQTIAQSRNLFNSVSTNSNSFVSTNNCYYSDTDTKEESIDVYFDIHSKKDWNDGHKFMISSNGFSKGIHEWKIRIHKSNDLRMEFGVVSTVNANVEMNEYGVCATKEFGQRAVYGYNKLTNLNSNAQVIGNVHHFYYESHNKNGSVRCQKDLSQLSMHRRAWKEGDIIGICANLNKGIIKFYLNSKQVRKQISIERCNVMYYPIIAYSGECQFEVI